MNLRASFLDSVLDSPMAHGTRPLLASLLALSGVLLWSPPARACSCAPPPPPREALEASDAVFEGRVIEVEPQSGTGLGPGRLQAQVQVVRTFKGADAETLTLTTSGSSASCGYPFEAGESYLIYAHAGAEHLQVSLCSRTRPIAAADEDLEALGMGYVPADPVAPDDPDELTTQDAKPVGAETRSRGGCASCDIGGGGPALPLVAVAVLWGVLGWRARRKTGVKSTPRQP